MKKHIIWKVEKRKIEELKPHSKNPRIFTEKGMKDLKKSIDSIGFAQPININQDNTILSGHARLKTLELQGIKEVDVYVPDRLLTPKQEEEVLVRMNANTAGEWDFDILANQFELEEISDWGLDVPNIDLDEEEELQDEEEVIKDDKSVLQYNQFALFGRHNNYDIPVLKKDMLWNGNIDDVFFDKKQLDETFKEKTFLFIEGGRVSLNTYNEALANNVVGFFADDFRFEKVWNSAVDLMEFYKKNKVQALLTPNFSLWADEPLPFQILSWYKTQWCGRFWQEAGMKVVPTLNFSTKESHDFCFLGVPEETPMVFFQIRNAKTNLEVDRCVEGVKEAYKRIGFKRAYFYGSGKTKKSQEILTEFSTLGFEILTIESWTDKKF